MLEYSRWKFLIAALVLAASVIYALPNLYPQDPAVQVTANRGGTVDATLVERARGLLEAAGVQAKAVTIENDNLLVRLRNPDDQIKASDALKAGLGESYTSALSLASTVPAWLAWFNAEPMRLGLDLQGGVHFLMQIDEQSALEKRREAFLDEIRAKLREEDLRVESLVQTPEGILVRPVQPADLDRLRRYIAEETPDLVVQDGEGGALLARIPPAVAQAITEQAVEQNVTALRNRIYEANRLIEPVVQRQGSGRVVVELPGVQDTAEIKRIIGATATLEFRAVVGSTSYAQVAQTALDSGLVPPDARLYYLRSDVPGEQGAPVLLSKRLIVAGEQLVDARPGVGADTGMPEVSIELSAAGGNRMFSFSSENVGEPMAVVYIEKIPVVRMVDGVEVREWRTREEVISVSIVQEPLGRAFRTTGLASAQEASDLAKLIRAGALSAPMAVIEERVIGPSLGADNVRRGVQAVVGSFLFVLAFFLVYYRMFGLITNIALLLNLLMVIAVMSVFGATITLPGLAGIALTVGLSVDANVLVNERIREELRAGNSPLASIATGFDKAAGTIADANVTALLAGLALLAFGTGPIQSFAITLILGILTSLYTAVSVSRGVATLIYGRRRKLSSIAI